VFAIVVLSVICPQCVLLIPHQPKFTINRLSLAFAATAALLVRSRVGEAIICKKNAIAYCCRSAGDAATFCVLTAETQINTRASM
jgi:hypothetical protein